MDEIIDKLVSILKKHGAKKIEIFGSYARGEQKETSDLDVIVEFEKRKSLLELVGIEQELEDALGIKVDLLTRASISPYLIERIEKESKVVLG
ncbi:MAG: nucleotidyltransferase family protein [Canidatus Methanoxibalbensis ujae]|nr:nucleotidyltransferase family protein [Candidatus Methanoxibalbensis ujae]